VARSQDPHAKGFFVIDASASANDAAPTQELRLEVETSRQERIAALRAGGAHFLGANKSLRKQMFVALLLCVPPVFAGVFLFEMQPALATALIATTYFAAVLWARRARFAALADQSAMRYALVANEAGLLISGQHGETHLAWSAVDSIETRHDALLIYLRGFQCLWLPVRSFASQAQREALPDLVQLATGLTAPHCIALPQTFLPVHFERAFVTNLREGLGLLALRASSATRLQASVPQLVALVLLAIGISFAGSLWRSGLDGQFNVYAVPSAIFGIPWLLLAAWTAAKLARNEQLTLPAADGVQALWCWLALVSQLLSMLPESAWNYAGSAALIVWYLPFAYGMFASLVTLVRITGMPREQRVGALLAVIYLIGAPAIFAPQNQELWIPAQRERSEATAEQRERWEAPSREAILYSQPRLLDETMARVQPGTPGKPELFLLALGGHGAQDVFMREVKSVEQLFAERFGTHGHSAVLLNNPTTLAQYPLASVTALEQSLQGIAQRMNRDEDVLFLFMTSHGGDDFRFDLSMWPFKFDDLTPQRLKAALDKAGIRRRVVVVSSCYSGGFVPPLADANTWVMTAARADRNSHGCSHEADWTFFGRAFFAEALHHTRSFEQAFDMAKQSIAQREEAEKLTPSEPQTGGGEAVKAVLRKMFPAGA
jgi:hypothetical protein